MSVNPATALDDIIGQVSEEPNTNLKIPFRKLAEMAGLDPARDFRGRDLVELDFRDEDLSGFDFSNADLRGTDFRRAKLNGASFQGAQTEGAIGIPNSEVMVRPSGEFNQQLAKQLIIKGEVPPPNWVEQLRTLRLGSSGIRDFTVLSSLKNLERLSLKSTKFDSIQFVSNLKKLHTLELNSTKVTDLRPISSLGSLRVLDLSYCKRLCSVDSLADLRRLSHLDISGTLIDTLEFARSLEYLHALNISYSKIGNLEPLSKLNMLRSLQAFGLSNSLFETLPLLSTVTALGISTSRADLENVAKLQGLRQLSILDSEIHVPVAFSALIHLSELVLQSNSVLDLENIPLIRNLSRLEIRYTRRVILDKIAEGTSLKEFILVRSSVDLAEVVTKLDISSLKCEYSQVANLEAVDLFPNLSSISFVGSGKLDVQKLMTKPQMRWIQNDQTYYVRTGDDWVTYN